MAEVLELIKPRTSSEYRKFYREVTAGLAAEFPTTTCSDPDELDEGGVMSVDRVQPWQSNLDARSIVPIADEMGGVVLYIAGEPAYYILNGEWFEAKSIERRKKTACDRDRSLRVF